MAQVEVRPLEGMTQIGGKLRKTRVKDIEIVLLDGVQIATIPSRPGASIGLLGGVRLSPAESKAVSDAIAKAHNGVPPSEIREQATEHYEIIDDEESDE